MFSSPSQKNELILYPQDFCREALTWKLLFHPHILEFCGVSQDLYPNTLCMVSVWLNNGNLIQYIKNLDFIEHEVHRLVSCDISFAQIVQF